ncbi:MAG: 4'-phosphopantetheinyl transferase superfamily protein [Clostridiales bacterium]|nr:4'-phosphopantetheinyl transferase superfamily protein [Clostridiales bacterium]
MVKIWLAAVRADGERFALEQNLSLLSPGEAERLSRRREEDQKRSVAGRWLLSQLLATHCPELPFPPRLDYGWQDKPLLADAPELGFNLSHSGPWAVCALCAAPVGVDIQEERPLRRNLIRRFAPAEQALLEALPERERQPAFYDLWCLKEAYCKCTGDGLRTPLNATAFTLNPVRVNKPGYRAALAPFPAEGCHLAVCVQTAEPLETKLRVFPEP